MAKKKAKLQLLHTAYFSSKLKELTSPSVIFLGRSNVGKSSLINALTHSSLAHVSKIPGKTRSVNYYQYSPHLILIDLPGYGYAKRSQKELNEWAELMHAFFEKLSESTLAYLLMDSKRELEEEEENLITALLERNADIKILLTKSDRLNQSLRKQRENYILRFLKEKFPHQEIQWQFVSVKNLESIEEIQKEMYQYGQNRKN